VDPHQHLVGGGLLVEEEHVLTIPALLHPKVVHLGMVEPVVVDKETTTVIPTAIQRMDKPTPEVVAVGAKDPVVQHLVDLVLLSSIILYNNIILI